MSTPDPFLRQRVLDGFGEAGQSALGRARVAIVGVGGLGCPAALYLATSGVGSLTLIDADAVAVSNLHRQVLFGPDDVGAPKVEAAARALARVAPWCAVEPVPERLGVESAGLLDGHDLVIDATDGWPSRRAVAAAAHAAGAPVVWGAAVGWFGQVAIFGRGATLEDVFPPGADLELDTCEGQGVAAVTCALVGAAMAAHATAVLLGTEAAEGRLLSVDARSARWRETRIGAPRV